ncbi:metal-sensitive transcriptional regulator [Brevibacillus thermoruber]|uniref:Metal-sensitive transcriptional regulator n=1 Tax=Brevibacillus thermoruber TaxID=33942 RepID=A0A9X3TU14_9BACL|nr:metal-sensitive transcriptional regulator [Brevibacillus thermoruber]MDA5110909.1 metal-sensitive transcriptional regulator [Brevibacillus thermoruber]
MNYGRSIMHRLKRVEGQIKGILNMMDAEKDCKEVVSQLSAVRSAIDKTIAVIVAENLSTCIREEMAAGKDTNQLLDEAIDLLIKSR